MSGAAPARDGDAPSGAPASEVAHRFPRRGRWATAVALVVAVLSFGVVDGFPLVAFPLGVLLVALSVRPRWWWFGVIAVLWALALTPGGAMRSISQGWALLLAGSFLVVTLLCPRWRFFSRALAAVAAALAVVGIGLTAGGGWTSMQWVMENHFRSIGIVSARNVTMLFPDSPWAGNLVGMSEQVSRAQSALYPAFLALQSLAALALAWWGFVRSRPGSGRRRALRPLREFRFNDSLIWLVIAGLVLVVAPLGEEAVRAGYNLLLFMAALYVLRGVAVFVFLSRGRPTLASVVLGALAAVFFYPVLFTAALLVGLGDTWLDVRGRVMAAASRV
jgi:hypothetical protein